LPAIIPTLLRSIRMRRLLLSIVVVAVAMNTACGVLLGLSDDDTAGTPSADASTDGGAVTAEGGSDGNVGEPDAGRQFRVFLTSKEFTMAEIDANLDGLCDSQLPPALAGRRFVPWLSTSTRSARDAIKGEGPWRTLLGDMVAANRAALFGGTLESPINVDEHGVRLLGGKNVWTGTTPAGDRAANCSDWKTLNQKVLVGSNVKVDATWTALSADPTCEAGSTPVYCFESE
jgi:hypothetical protein